MKLEEFPERVRHLIGRRVRLSEFGVHGIVIGMDDNYPIMIREDDSTLGGGGHARSMYRRLLIADGYNADSNRLWTFDLGSVIDPTDADRIEAWKRGGCVVCAGPDRGSFDGWPNEYAHSECWRNADWAERERLGKLTKSPATRNAPTSTPSPAVRATEAVAELVRENERLAEDARNTTALLREAQAREAALTEEIADLKAQLERRRNPVIPEGLSDGEARFSMLEVE